MADPNLFDFIALCRFDDSLLLDAHAWLAGGDPQGARQPEED